jgi:hypothetical protein
MLPSKDMKMKIYSTAWIYSPVGYVAQQRYGDQGLFVKPPYHQTPVSGSYFKFVYSSINFCGNRTSLPFTLLPNSPSFTNFPVINRYVYKTFLFLIRYFNCAGFESWVGLEKEVKLRITVSPIVLHVPDWVKTLFASDGFPSDSLLSITVESFLNSTYVTVTGCPPMPMFLKIPLIVSFCPLTMTELSTINSTVTENLI